MKMHVQIFAYADEDDIKSINDDYIIGRETSFYDENTDLPWVNLLYLKEKYPKSSHFEIQVEFQQ